ncbi:nucleoside/nucleotide kinase family protein [Trueperella bialowiezensis]|uniref:Uridine kinase n=1 Tax=Trueperella bialowiezensis TaxID=312285 RepID=A0A448PC22_9ACTO|nr:hypothetical protein [Trueperella bialowiezensis]VEI12382.1 Uncharacterised protein [Trueperella bialowiezensis]
MTNAHEVNTASAIAAVTARIRELTRRPGLPVLVGIDGRSGAGKTSFAAQLEHEIGNSSSFEVENHIAGWHGLTAGISNVATIVADIRREGHTRAPIWDWEHNMWGPHVAIPERSDSDVVFVVGCGSTSAQIRPHLDLSVWLDVPESVRKARVRARDPYDWSDYWDAWAAQEAELLDACPSHLNADVIVRSSL